MPDFPVQQGFGLAVQCYRAGRWAEAESACRQVLAVAPDHVDALRLLGLLALRSGRHHESAQVLRRAVSLAPNAAALHNDLGTALAAVGQIGEAIDSFREAARLDPGNADFNCNLGAALLQAGCFVEASQVLERGVAARTSGPQIHLMLGDARKQLGELNGAIRAYLRAIELSPNNAQAHMQLGLTYRAAMRPEDALYSYRRATQLAPQMPEAQFNLGNVLRDLGQLSESVEAYEKALAARPNYADAWHNLAAVFEGLGRVDAAIDAFRRVIALNPELPEARHGLGNALKSSCDLDSAIASYRKALELRPGFTDAQYNLAITLLLQGNYEEGWKRYESRWLLPGSGGLPKFDQPLWQGEELRGRRLLLYAEQGLGDAIQFIRYAPILSERGAQVIVRCARPLRRLFENSLRGIQIIDDVDDRLPEFDVHLPMLSVPRVLGTTLASIPASVPYLRPSVEAVERWSVRMAGGSGFPKVGLAWAGNPKNENDARRSMSLSEFAPATSIADARFYGLQLGTVREQLRALEGRTDVIDLADGLSDFAETAAAMMNLDLVVTVDTAVAHLAGALGKPVWILLPYVPDWRWLLGRSDSPWYPTARLFRQKRHGDWTSVVSEIAAQLREWKL